MSSIFLIQRSMQNFVPQPIPSRPRLPPIPTKVLMENPSSCFLHEQIPILDLKSLQDLSPMLYRRLQQWTLLSSLRINTSCVILPGDMRHIDGNKDIGFLCFQSDQQKQNPNEIRFIAPSSLFLARWRCGEESVCWNVLTIPRQYNVL